LEQAFIASAATSSVTARKPAVASRNGLPRLNSALPPPRWARPKAGPAIPHAEPPVIADLLVSRQRPLTPIHERDEAPIPAVLWPQDVIAWRSGLVCLTAEKGRDFKLVVVDRGIDLRLHRHDIGGTRRGCRSDASAAALIGALRAQLRLPVL